LLFTHLFLFSTQLCLHRLTDLFASKINTSLEEIGGIDSGNINNIDEIGEEEDELGLD
jgi:hypothetical protein